MLPHQIFEKMRREVESQAGIGRNLREPLIQRINFFYREALCDLDRRSPQKHLQFAWKDIEALKAKRKLFLWTNESPAWDGLRHFFGWPPKPAAPPPPPKEPKALDAGEVFVRLLYDLDRLKGEKRLPRDEYITLFFGLQILRISERTMRMHRDMELTLRTWKTIWPLLEKHRMLTPYKTDPRTVHAVKQFFRI